MPDREWVAELILLDQARVVDGDTIWAYARGFYRQIHYVEYRLNGWDCPEARGPTPFERQQAYLARATVKDWLMAHHRAGTPVYARTLRDPEKYGRWLADIWAEPDADLGEHLASLDLAVPYSGSGARWRNTYIT